jgi:microcompartment protein CcmL/EutN
MMTPPAIAVLEFDSIAIGTRAADAMVKRAPITVFRIGTVHPGKFLVVVGGSVADVQESRAEGLLVGGEAVRTEILLPDVHQQVFDALGGKRRPNTGDALGVIETTSIPINIAAADKAVKTADVTIIEIRLGDGLGGKGITHLAGVLHDVQAAVEAAVAVATRVDGTVCHSIIPIQHAELRKQIGKATGYYK